MDNYSYPLGADCSDAPWNQPDESDYIRRIATSEIDSLDDNYIDYVSRELTNSPRQYISSIKQEFPELSNVHYKYIIDALNDDDELFSKVAKFLAPILIDSYTEERYNDIASNLIQ